MDGKELEGTGVVAGNVRLYGSGYVITPEARLEEPMLDVVVFQGRSGLAYLRYLFGVAGGFHVKFKDVVHFHAERLEVVADGWTALPTGWRARRESTGSISDPPQRPDRFASVASLASYNRGATRFGLDIYFGWLHCLVSTPTSLARLRGSGDRFS